MPSALAARQALRPTLVAGRERRRPLFGLQARERIVVGESSHPFRAGDPPAVPFEAHIELLRSFVARRAEIVARIEGLLNAQRKPPQYLQDVPFLARQLEDSFFTLAGLAPELSRLKRQLDEAHWASGFKPRQEPGQHNDVIDPAELMSRAFLMWQRTRWPGHYARVLYAQTLFNLYLLRRLMLLAMRLWDAGTPRERLAQIQAVLDELWRTTPKEQPVLVRDARWLFPLAQSPTTNELHGYFEVGERIAETLAYEDRLAIFKASVRMAGGHLRSQLRHVSTQNGVPLDEHGLVLSTRKSNALDLATLLEGLVPLLEAYERATISGDNETRLELADAILQGVSPDPELFLNRLDLLRPYSMIEHLFIATDRDGRAAYTPMGLRHLRLLEEYAALLGRVAKQLNDDCTHFRPADHPYSPYGVLYGFSSRLLEHMALKATQPDAVTAFSLEDVFVGGDAAKLAWVSGWRRLPHVPREVAKLFEYPQKFAEEVFERIERALRRRTSGAETAAAPRNGRLFVVAGDQPEPGSNGSPIPELPRQFVLSSDRQVVGANRATAYDRSHLSSSRLEGEFIVSYETPGGWVGVSKDILTDVLGAGRDARIAGLPSAAGHVLKLMCPELVVLSPNAKS